MIERLMTLLAREVLDGDVALDVAEVIDRMAEVLGRSPVGESPRERIADGLMRASSSDGPIIWIDGSMEVDESGRIVDVATLADGVVLTHRITAEEIDRGALDITTDLALLVRLTEADGGLFLAVGEPLHHRVRSRRGEGRGGTLHVTNALVGPPRWLETFGAGELVAVRVEHGILTVEPAPDGPAVYDPSAIEASVIEALRAAMATVNGGDGNPTDAATLQVMGLIDGWLPPGADGPPLADLLVAAGLETSGALVGRAGGWEDYAELSRAVEVIGGHGPHLPDEELTTLSRVIDAFRAWRDDRTARPPGGLVDALSQAPYALGCVGEELRALTDDGALITGFLDALDAPGGRRGAGVDVLRAMALAMQDRPLEAEALLDGVLEHSPNHPGALKARAWYDSDRGDARSSLRRLQQVHELDEETVAILRARAGDVGPTVGRNDPCPCGSGRKFKQCHLNRTDIDDGVRLSWMMDKARDHIAHLAPHHLLWDLTAHPSVAVGSDRGVLGEDLALFEEGWLARFLAARGPLLPERERTLMECWLSGHSAGAFRVVARADHITLVAVDERGDDLTGADHTRTVPASRSFENVAEGETVWVRLLPWDDGWVTSGITLHLPDRRTVGALAAAWAERDWPEAFAVMVGDRPSPALDARTGHPLVAARAVWGLEPDQVPAARETLDGAFEPTGAGWDDVNERGETRWEVDDRGILAASSTTWFAHDGALSFVAEGLAPAELLDEVILPQGQAAAFRADEDVLEAIVGAADEDLDLGPDR